MARTKTVVDAGQVAHLWANRSQPSARNGGRNNFYFEGDTIYSYGRHFPIARHVVNKRGERAILFTTRTYSSTTAKHICYVREAIARDALVFHISNPDMDPLAGERYAEEAVKDYRDRVERELEASAKPRIRQATRDAAIAHARHLADECNAMADFFGLRGSKYRIVLPADVGEYLENRKAQIAAAERKAAKERAAAQARRDAEGAEALRLWLSGENWIGTEGQQQRTGLIVSRLSATYLRICPIDGDTVQTSKGADFPERHGRRAYRMLAALRSRQGRIAPDMGGTSIYFPDMGNATPRSVTLRVGAFTVDSFDGDTVRAGCHVLTWSEIDRFAKLRGWDVPPVTAADATPAPLPDEADAVAV